MTLYEHFLRDWPAISRGEKRDILIIAALATMVCLCTLTGAITWCVWVVTAAMRLAG
jgi:hypothetical protein